MTSLTTSVVLNMKILSYHGSEPYSDAEEEDPDRYVGVFLVRPYRVCPEPELIDALALLCRAFCLVHA